MQRLFNILFPPKNILFSIANASAFEEKTKDLFFKNDTFPALFLKTLLKMGSH